MTFTTFHYSSSNSAKTPVPIIRASEKQDCFASVSLKTCAVLSERVFREKQTDIGASVTDLEWVEISLCMHTGLK